MHKSCFLFGPNDRLFDEPTVQIEVTPARDAQAGPSPEPEETDDEEISDALAAELSSIRDRHAEIISRIDECKTKLEQLSTAENPTLSVLQTELASLRSELADLKSLMVLSQANPTPNTSPEPQPEPGVLLSQDVLIDEPNADGELVLNPTPEPKPKNRFI